MIEISAVPEETAHRDRIMTALRAAIRGNATIHLPRFNPARSAPHDEPALLRMGEEPNDFGGEVGDFRYQFEGEDDLLHHMVTRKDLKPLTVEEAQQVVAFLLPHIPPGLIWLKPAERSQHFHFGHDQLT